MAFRHHETLLHRNHQCRILRRSEWRLWVFKAIRILKTSIEPIYRSSFFWCPGCRKRVGLAVPQIKILLQRLHKSRFLKRPEGRLCVLRTFRLLKTSLKQIRPSCYFRWPGCKKMISNGLLTRRNFVSSTLSTSIFKTPRRQFMFFQGQSHT
jgi:hypothetical protein